MMDQNEKNWLKYMKLFRVFGIADHYKFGIKIQKFKKTVSNFIFQQFSLVFTLSERNNEDVANN